MYYDSYKSRRPGRRDLRRHRRSGSCLGFIIRRLLRLVAILLILAVLFACLLYFLPMHMWNVELPDTELSINGDLPGGRLNVLVLGLDELNETMQRSDSMIIVSVGAEDVRLVSVQRDTMVDVPGYGRKKINAAYACGGAEMAMRCVNEAFHMNITRYITVDYVTLVKLIDAAGGIDIEISDAELEQMNENVGMSAYIFKPLGYDAEPMTQSGNVHLNGLFALGYSRIRKTDSDYMRTYRQRAVIQALVAAIRGNIADPSMYIKFIGIYQNYVDTNLSLPALVSLAEHILLAKSIQQTRTPCSDYSADDGSAINITDDAQNAGVLHSFLYDPIAA